jgi:hypothetical protein
MVLSGGGAQVYDLAAEQRFDTALASEVLRPGQSLASLPFVFAPFSLLVLAPLAALPFVTAQAFWLVLNIAALLAVPLVFRRHFGLSDTATGFAILLSPFFIPVLVAVLHGQTSPLLALLLSLVFLSLERENYATAGVTLALAAWKPQLVVPALVAFAAAGLWRTIAAFTATSGALLAASAMQIGWRAVFVGFPQSILAFVRLPRALFGEDVRHMPNLRALWLALLGPGMAARVPTVGSSLLLLLVLATVFRRRYRASLRIKFALLLVSTVLLSYHCYVHDAVLLLPAALLLCGANRELRSATRRLAVWTVAAAIYLAAFIAPHSASMLAMSALMVIMVTLLATMVIVPTRASRLRNNLSPARTFYSVLPARSVFPVNSCQHRREER